MFGTDVQPHIGSEESINVLARTRIRNQLILVSDDITGYSWPLIFAVILWANGDVGPTRRYDVGLSEGVVRVPMLPMVLP